MEQYLHRFKFLAYTYIICMLIPLATFAQERIQLSGTIFDENNQSIPGVNIVIEGTSNGTITDSDGNFTITADKGSVLVFSYMGYSTIKQTVNNNSPIKINMQPDLVGLDEVVVIGYGVQKKKLVTGATAQVKGDELQKKNGTNALQALQGKTSGVNITSTSGQPGEGMKVIVRGTGTLNNSAPLYIVDGVQVGSIDYLNNSDIESIDILKDAASAAIYGAQGANGVILVTTKQGKTGFSQVSFDAYYGWQNRPKKIEMLNANEYANMVNREFQNSGGTYANAPFVGTDGKVQLPMYIKDANGNPINANTDWLDEMFVKNAVTQNYNLAATGGSETSTYSISIGYTGQEGIVGGSDVSNYQRSNGRANSEHKLYNGRVKVGEHFMFANTKKNGLGVGNIYGNSLRGAFNVTPLMPVYDNNGDYFNSNSTTNEDFNLLSKTYGNTFFDHTVSNPYAAMMLTNQNETKTQNLLADLYTEIEIISNLKLRTTFGIDYSSSDYRSFTPIYELSNTNSKTRTSASQNMSKNMTWNLDNVLSYHIEFENHNIDLMAGNSIRSYKGSWVNAKNSDLAFNDFKHAYISNATYTGETGEFLSVGGAPTDENKMLSYFGRIQYNLKETYMFNVVLRADGSSKFADGNRWGYFPSVSAGWVLSNESFLEGTSNWLNFLKLRGSWGQNGNSNIDAYAYLAPIAFTNATYPIGNGEGAIVNQNGSYPSKLSNENLKWETSEQIDLGFDARLLDSKLSVEFDFYRKNTKDWLVEAPVVATAGADAPYINGGSVVNSGVELSLGYNSKVGDFSYSINANASYNKNKVGSIPTEDGIIHGATNSLYNNSEEFYRAADGHPIGYFWGYKTNGIFQTNAEAQNATVTPLQSKPVAGDMKYVDVNGDGKITEADKTDIGDPNPDLMYGLTISLEYKAFDFSLVGNGVAGNQIVQSYRGHGKYDNYTKDIYNNSWSPTNTGAKYPRVTNDNINWKFSDIYIHKGDYFRISNITLGFDIAKVINIKNLSQFRIYTQVQNLYTFTSYNGMDPEIGYGLDNGSTDRFSSGIDLGYYPRPRTVLFGVNLKF